jgi:hypothetical protein
LIRRRDTGPCPESGRIEISISGTAGIRGAASSRPEAAPPVAGLDASNLKIVRLIIGLVRNDRQSGSHSDGSSSADESRWIARHPARVVQKWATLNPAGMSTIKQVSSLAVGNVAAVASAKVSIHRMADVSTSWPICQSPATDKSIPPEHCDIGGDTSLAGSQISIKSDSLIL